ncbi:sugar phosphate isomerase/epimerase family protein [Paenibacillus sp.]|uniref:sugar phosphate isomerase/epimerase family protein n=1 Tax=Paenibacillus sp. TaxID=58172 RepID=UPI002810FA30|nr:sugar phosphate isomerase/epimerase family protein [Paenibacillus sp.]
MLKGINQWCFPDGTPIETVLEHSGKAGYDAIELNLQQPGNPGITMESTTQELEALGRLARSHGLALKSISCGLMGGSSLSSPDEETRERGRRIVTRQLEVAGLLGMETALLVPAFVNDKGEPYDEAYKRSQDEISKLIPVAERNGVDIGVENVWNKFLYSPLEMARYIDELGSPVVGAYFDVGNIINFGYPEQSIRILGSRIKKIHVKDFRRSVGTAYGVVTLLSGDVNWIAVREALQAIGYDGPLTAELSAYPYAPYQLVYDTARHLDVIIHGGVR